MCRKGGRTLNILVVDDESIQVETISRGLKSKGYRVTEAMNADEALGKINKVGARIDMVITDYSMPGMNGLETFKVIHRIDPKLPAIIMTAFGNTETAIEATKLGAFDYVLKPFEIPDMLGIIQQALEAGRFMRSPVAMTVQPFGTVRLTR